MKKIISFCLWGNNPKYTTGAIENAKLAKEIYPNWIPRFYVGTSTDKAIVEQLKVLNSEVVQMPEQGNWSGMFWRFYPASDKDVDIMISRDCDSRLNFREKAAVDYWLNETDKEFHIMRDHPAHSAAIMGGMWGVRNGFLSNMKELIWNYSKGNFWQVDQNFLAEIVYPIVYQNSCVHDPFFQQIEFPTERMNYEFVGDVFDENNLRHSEYWKDFIKK